MYNAASKKIVLIGAGNLAHHLAKLLLKRGHEIIQVYGRTEAAAKQLGMKLFSVHTTVLQELKPDADIYIICVKDKAIAEVAAKLKPGNKLVLHTSGATSMQVLKGSSKKYGVLYPLQTFSAQSKVKWNKIPFLIEGNTAAAKNEVLQFALGLVKEVYEMNSEKRMKLHLAAVFACNFSNHLYTLSKQYLEEEGIPLFHLLAPLIQQTAKKIKKNNPAEVQTGPAVRNDEAVMKQHLQLLKGKEKFRKVYEVMSNSIKNVHTSQE